MSDLSLYFLGSWKDGEFDKTEDLREKSENGKLVKVYEDTTTRVYEDVNYVDVAALYAEACADEGMYVMYEKDSNNDRDRYFECESSDSELNDSKYVYAYDKDGDVLYSASYLDIDENDVFRTSETIGRSAALDILDIEIGGDEDVVRVGSNEN